MNTTIYCKPTGQGVLSFYLLTNNSEYLMFCQNYRKGVHEFFSQGVRLKTAQDYSKANHDSAVIKTMNKIPTTIKYLEKEYGIEVLEQTKKKKAKPVRNNTLPHRNNERSEGLFPPTHP